MENDSERLKICFVDKISKYTLVFFGGTNDTSPVNYT